MERGASGNVTLNLNTGATDATGGVGVWGTADAGYVYGLNNGPYVTGPFINPDYLLAQETDAKGPGSPLAFLRLLPAFRRAHRMSRGSSRLFAGAYAPSRLVFGACLVD